MFIFFLIVIIVFIYFFVFRKKQVIYTQDGIVIDKINHTEKKIIKSQTIKTPKISNELTYSFWLYIHEFYFNYSNWKHIFHKGTTIENRILDYKYWSNIENEIPEQSPGVWMHPSQNTIRLCMTTESETLEYIDIPNIKIKIAHNISLVFHNKTLDIYINAKLIKTKIFKETPVFNTKSIYFNFPKTFNGTLYNFNYIPRQLFYNDLSHFFSSKPEITKIKNTFTTNILDTNTLLNRISFVPNKQIKPSEKGLKFTYTMWIFIRNTPENAMWNNNYNFKKYIIKKNASPDISYTPSKNTLNIDIAYKDELNETSVHTTTVPNIKQQTWIHLGVVLNGKNINIFTNGQLSNSSDVPNVPFIYNKNLYFGDENNQFNSYIYNVNYFNTNLSSKKINYYYNKQKGKLPKI
jgi:hypothetical protein